MKDKIIVWTPDEPSGYGAFDEDGYEITVRLSPHGKYIDEEEDYDESE